MRCSEAMERSSSSSAAMETPDGRVVINGGEPRVFLHFVPRLVDSDRLNDAGSAVREFTTVDAAVTTAASDFGAVQLGWIPLEDLPASDSTIHTAVVEAPAPIQSSSLRRPCRLIFRAQPA